MNESHPMTVVENWQGTTNGKTLLQDDGAAMRVYNPARRLFVVGAVHIAQALIPMAKQVGYTMVVIDPSRCFTLYHLGFRGLLMNPYSLVQLLIVVLMICV